MKTDIVGFEVALLARDKGYVNGSDFYFDINTEHLYVWNDMIGSIGCKNGHYPEHIEAPYRSELQKWLRDKHNIHIEVRLHRENYYSVFIPSSELGYIYEKTSNRFKKFDTFEQALEEGLKQGLTLIEI